MDFINSLATDTMSKALDGLAKRHQAIAGNLANVDTPNYKRRDVSFEGALSSALQAQQHQGDKHLRPTSNDDMMTLRTTDKSHFSLGNSSSLSIEDVQPTIEEQGGLEYRKDGNSVDVETEMVELSRNTQRYTAVAKMESGNYKSMKAIINGGGG